MCTVHIQISDFYKIKISLVKNNTISQVKLIYQIYLLKYFTYFSYRDISLKVNTIGEN